MTKLTPEALHTTNVPSFCNNNTTTNSVRPFAFITYRIFFFHFRNTCSPAEPYTV